MLPLAASASSCPAVALRQCCGAGGQRHRQQPPLPVRAGLGRLARAPRPRPPAVTSPAAPLGQTETDVGQQAAHRRKAGDSVQAPPGSHAASRLACRPAPAASTAVVLAPDVASASTRHPTADRPVGSRGPVRCHAPADAVEDARPLPGRLQAPASIGSPCCRHAAAVSSVSPQPRPAAGARDGGPGDQRGPGRSRGPALRGGAASGHREQVAAGPLRRARRPRWPGPGCSGPASRPCPPPFAVAASGENFRSWLGRKPVSAGCSPGSRDQQPAVVGHAGRSGELPRGRAMRPGEQLPEVLLLCRCPAHLHDGPACAVLAEDGRSERGQPGCARLPGGSRPTRCCHSRPARAPRPGPRPARRRRESGAWS